MLSEDTFLRYVRALYPVGLMLMLVPVVDLALRALPPQFGTLQWRYSTTGLFLGNYGTLVLGVALVGFTAALVGDRGILRIVGMGSLIMSVVTLAVLALFALDAIQLRQLVAANLKTQVATSAVGASFTGLVGTVAWFLMGRAAMTASRDVRSVSSRGRAPAPLVMAPGTGDAV